MFGKNPIRKPDKGNGLTLKVQEIFPTLQGEGPHTGVPAVFIRLGGCNLACDFCDTEFESFEEMSLAEIMHEIGYYAEDNSHPEQAKRVEGSHAVKEDSSTVALRACTQNDKRKLVVITGGEPLRQNIIPLCEALLAEGYQPQIETNGTLWRELPEAVEVVCSPKAANGQYHALRGDIIARINAIKFIISKTHEPYTSVPDIAEGLPVWLQPMDEYDADKNRANLDYAMELAEAHGYKLSIQTHKLTGID